MGYLEFWMRYFRYISISNALFFIDFALKTDSNYSGKDTSYSQGF